ncbi:hypothetical protein SAPIS_v1c05610 [Spiroplasma apis B31]|uniref:Uncharacterized protein n=1 Tax=Spiroplasma apis B31 TaxID=1276258 RepID=V5RJW6_SPIAP|nr:hypothetical protein SAPIS_v1c05610 [Spiroplasma apis B31]
MEKKYFKKWCIINSIKGVVNKLENKIYNLKESSLGKITFLDGTAFLAVSFLSDSGQKINEVLIVGSIDEGIKRLPSWIFDLTSKYIQDKGFMRNEITNWLIENWLDPGITTFKQRMAEKYGFDEFLNQDPIEWIKKEPEMTPLTLAHIAINFTNGYLSLPFREFEITVKFVKNILAINFWEEGNPKNSDPIK